jgi:hypothetical protein
MSMARLVFIFTLVACGSDGTSKQPDVDAAFGALCTGAVYDTCATNDQCGSQLCHLYNGAGLQICTQACSATAPCPNDASGAAVACNPMGNCKPAVANNCHR